MLETRCRKEVSPEITDCGQSVGQEPQDGNGLGPAVVRCHETTMQNNSAHPGAVFQRASMVEDACSVNGLRRSARISALGALSRGASQKETLPAKGTVLQALVPSSIPVLIALSLQETTAGNQKLCNASRMKHQLLRLRKFQRRRWLHRA